MRQSRDIKSALTACMASDGSPDPATLVWEPANDSISSTSTTTSAFGSFYTISRTSSKSLLTSFQLVKNHLLKRECEWISNRVTLDGKQWPSQMANVCASAWHRLVFLVPGGPGSNNRWFQLTILGDTPMSEKNKAESAYCSKLVLILGARMRESQSNSIKRNVRKSQVITSSSPLIITIRMF
jgi:hypothetical protein